MLRCAGCVCKPSVFDGHVPNRKVSMLEMHCIPVTESPDCVIHIVVRQDTTSGQHKVKIVQLDVAVLADGDVT